ncbi:MAG: DUF1365 domain-containing protein [Pseudomonadota bacterium]
MTGSETVSALYRGRVMHKRLLPFGHRFVYRVFSLWLDLEDIPKLGRRLRLFSYNRFNLLSFHDRDHGPRDGGPLRPWLESALDNAGIQLESGPIRLLCFPRVLGYVFNPLSIYFCYHADGQLKAIVHQVRNTFGEMHSYVIPVSSDHLPGAPIRQQCDKQFYVSPFIGMRARYHFRLHEPGDTLSIVIRQTVPEGQMLVASQTGRRRPLTDGQLLRAFFGHPLMTVKVMTAIHWQALWLWLKGAKFHRRPPPPTKAVTTVTTEP